MILDRGLRRFHSANDVRLRAAMKPGAAEGVTV